MPILAGGWFYLLGRDEDLLRTNLELGARLGSMVHNTQVYWRHESGRAVTNEEIAAFYLRAAEWGERCGCLPTFEVHINMWSEDFRRLSQVGDLVEQRGVPFRITLDHSHVIFKIDNEQELQMFDLQQAIDGGELVLDPDKPGNVCKEWIDRGYVSHCHARATVPNNPKNTKARHANGKIGRGVQYPFIRPEEGQFTAPWRESALEPWKRVVRDLLEHKAMDPAHGIGQISTEFIPFPDYGEGHGYSIWENSVACASWMRQTWASAKANAADQ